MFSVICLKLEIKLSSKSLSACATTKILFSKLSLLLFHISATAFSNDLVKIRPIDSFSNTPLSNAIRGTIFNNFATAAAAFDNLPPLTKASLN
ncbi:Uncharacterised protein [Chlamydia trachomatis]|nr:Uncharacterised protein [Chlamydia trachomatis]CRH46575.1 Uncharacterised protein [Chlamydia trachomatis]CRH54673.1 Uncharacterised protein [Chlamydia trachomatis]